MLPAPNGLETEVNVPEFYCLNHRKLIYGLRSAEGERYSISENRLKVFDRETNDQGLGKNYPPFVSTGEASSVDVTVHSSAPVEHRLRKTIFCLFSFLGWNFVMGGEQVTVHKFYPPGSTWSVR